MQTKHFCYGIAASHIINLTDAPQRNVFHRRKVISFGTSKSIILFVCLFVCLFALQKKKKTQTQLSLSVSFVRGILQAVQQRWTTASGSPGKKRHLRLITKRWMVGVWRLKKKIISSWKKKFFNLVFCGYFFGKVDDSFVSLRFGCWEIGNNGHLFGLILKVI